LDVIAPSAKMRALEGSMRTETISGTHRLSLLAAGLLALLAPATAAAQDAPAPPKEPPPPAADGPAEKVHYPKVGGHLGFGVPILTVGTPGTSLIGRDFGSLGLVGGINVALTPEISIDFESIAIGNFKQTSAGNKAPASATTFVFDPGIVYNPGPVFMGIRMAMRVPAPLGGAEFGLIPIIGKGFKVSKHIAYYIELDLPVFFNSPFEATMTTFIQTGIGF
jgi:hypothetical protein